VTHLNSARFSNEFARSFQPLFVRA